MHRPSAHTPAPFPRAIVTLITSLLIFFSCCLASAQPLDASLQKALAWQIALESRGYSPGILDGKPGAKTEHATRLFQLSAGLAPSARLDDRTAIALQIAQQPVTMTYVISPDDVRSVTGVTTDWIERSKMTRLGYESLADAVAERFHCTPALLQRLNPNVNMNALVAGQSITGLAIKLAPLPQAQAVEIDLKQKTIVALREGRVVALFHCSIAADKARRPSGQTTIATVVEDPSYTFDPKSWPEVKNVDRRLLIAPGPRNPVGVRWIGLALNGYGIHGTPWPHLIGKTGSHGCFRLANWDAARLAAIVKAGTPVTFIE